MVASRDFVGIIFAFFSVTAVPMFFVGGRLQAFLVTDSGIETDIPGSDVRDCTYGGNGFVFLNIGFKIYKFDIFQPTTSAVLVKSTDYPRGLTADIDHQLLFFGQSDERVACISYDGQTVKTYTGIDVNYYPLAVDNINQ